VRGAKGELYGPTAFLRENHRHFDGLPVRRRQSGCYQSLWLPATDRGRQPVPFRRQAEVVRRNRFVAPPRDPIALKV
jgi:hypothetical protein